jgi:WD40 repeat protein
VRVWDVESGREIRTFERHSHTVECAAFSPDGLRVLSGSWDGVVLCWEPESGRELSFCAAHPRAVTSLGFAPGGRFVTSSEKDPVIRLWQVPEPGQPAPPALEIPPKAPPPMAKGEVVRFAGHRNGVSTVAVSPDGRRVLTGSGVMFTNDQWLTGSENEVRLWDARTGRELRRFRGHTSAVFRVLFSHDGMQALSGGADGTVRLWDLDSGRQVRVVEGLGEVRALGWSSDGRRVAAGSKAGVVSVFDVSADRPPVRTLPGVGAAWGLALSPGGRQVAVGTDRDVRLGDVETGAWLKTFTGHTAHVRDVFFTADGKRLVSAGDDKTIRQWDVGTGQPVGGVLDQAVGITSMAVAPDGRHAVTAAFDGGIRLWDLREGRELYTFTGHALPAHGVTFSPDGKQLLSGGVDKTARLWRLPQGVR